MEETINVIITLSFADASTRNYTFSGIEGVIPETIRQKVKAINANVPSVFAQTFVSNDGFNCTGISNVRYVTVTEEVIYNAS